MKSRVAEAARSRLVEDVRDMTPEQRLEAFLVHSKLMAQWQAAAAKAPQSASAPVPARATPADAP